jgi:hypothetical protein
VHIAIVRIVIRSYKESVMTIATRQPIWDCRWSRPGFQVRGLEEHLQPEEFWVCVRRGERRGVKEEECAGCPYWEPLPEALTGH